MGVDLGECDIFLHTTNTMVTSFFIFFFLNKSSGPFPLSQSVEKRVCSYFKQSVSSEMSQKHGMAIKARKRFSGRKFLVTRQ